MKSDMAGGDDPLFTTKSLLNCASCAKGVTNMAGYRADNVNWDGFPQKDPTKRMLKSGMGFSKMFNQGQMASLFDMPSHSNPGPDIGSFASAQVTTGSRRKSGKAQRVKSGHPGNRAISEVKNSQQLNLGQLHEAVTNMSSTNELAGGHPDVNAANMNAVAGSLLNSVSNISNSMKHIRQLSPKSHLNGIGTKLKYQGNRLQSSGVRHSTNFGNARSNLQSAVGAGDRGLSASYNARP